MVVPKKSLGQNFLIDPNIIRKIITCSDIQLNETVVEIGPGKGALTKEIIKNGPSLSVVEKDERMVKILHSEASLDGVSIVHGDVLDVGIIHGEAPIKIVGNLPYNISTQILFQILESHVKIPSAFVMVQDDVANRILAITGKAYCPMGIVLQNRFEIKKEFKIKPGCFYPAPKVMSAFLSLKRREAPLLEIDSYKNFKRFLDGVFRYRRKTLVNGIVLSGISSKIDAEKGVKYIKERLTVRVSDVSMENLHLLYVYLQ